MWSLRPRKALLTALVAISIALSGCHAGGEARKPLAVVRFAMLPYGDHTYAIIGVKQGWFKDAGIDLQYQTVKIDNIVPLLKGGTYDAASVPPGILFASYDTAPELCTFVFGDLFQGYAIMSRSDPAIKSYAQFRAAGLPPADALRAAALQLRGKVFAYPSETAIKPFINLVLSKGGLRGTDYRALVLDDPLTVNAMRNKQADFQVGGVPSRLVLQREGFKPIITSKDIADTAKPSPDSPELAAILQNGWATTKTFYRSQHDTVLRLASVNLRIMRFIKDHPKDALALQLPYLSEVTGQPFSQEEGEIIYSSLDPFYTFEMQRAWFTDTKSPYYYGNVNGSILREFVSKGIYKNTPPAVSDVIYAADVYRDLDKLRSESSALLDTAAHSDAYRRTPETIALYDRAKNYFDSYDFLDAQVTAQDLVKKLETK